MKSIAIFYTMLRDVERNETMVLMTTVQFIIISTPAAVAAFSPTEFRWDSHSFISSDTEK